MTGTLRSWFSQKNYGFVAVSFKETYFLHGSNITEIPDGIDLPPVGATVHFDVAPARGKGKLPMAVNARIMGEGGAL